MLERVSFGSDNHSGVHPAIMQAVVEANFGHQPAYGSDQLTAKAEALFRKHFGSEARSYFVFTGTAANTLAIRSVCAPFEAVISTDCAHINVDECGAPEANGGHKILTMPHARGKLTLNQLMTLEINTQNPHRVLPRLVSLTQATELGTVYDLQELREICRWSHGKGLLVHMDGARLANAAAFLGCSLREVTVDCGVDLVSFGGTKNGLLGAESLVFLREGIGKHFAFLRKQGMQLASKMRFLSAQFVAYLENDLWYSNAVQANSVARYLAEQLKVQFNLATPWPVEANEVFVKVSPESELAKIFCEIASAYLWDDGLLRFVCSFDSTLAHVDQLLKEAKARLAVKAFGR